MFSKHTVHRQGYLQLITTKDGDNKTNTLAWAICETESGNTCEYFSNKCYETDLSRYLSGTSAIFSDRQKGIKKFHDKFQSKIGRCFNHIIGNCRKHIHGTGQTLNVKSAWALLRNDPMEVDYRKTLVRLTRQSPLALQQSILMTSSHTRMESICNECRRRRDVCIQDKPNCGRS